MEAIARTHSEFVTVQTEAGRSPLYPRCMRMARITRGFLAGADPQQRMRRGEPEWPSQGSLSTYASLRMVPDGFPGRLRNR